MFCEQNILCPYISASLCLTFYGPLLYESGMAHLHIRSNAVYIAVKPILSAQL